MRISGQASMTLTLILLVPAGLHPQISAAQPGKLNIYSNPTGAVVSINGDQTDRHTDGSFVVTPGSYTVVVKTLSGQTLTCSAAPPGKLVSGAPGAVKVEVSPGETVTITCK